ncbi:tyrosine-type recombinase/integrase [Bacteroides helcogenes]|uniref:Integrase family protein n=1 Tax=Bacteroides helcogenes (strain ATCC 35417 / DSM 20613 / JCM 6297 / CCUG 15421 / P 36-108) TaxID=693979 RepID=E6SNJ6_BACT6|nr:tyrosine-type recombinase/integrase [Bacteroides helcogenes]ADV43745.1 integrase family protein [Bacteroides helcogenes P 36-108]MDY5237605.1 tyrosine-type recombinase/integrase [Bacteroides helcogenes]
MEDKALYRKESVVSSDLSDYVADVIAALKEEKKYAAAHNYLSTLCSFIRFWGDRELPASDVSVPLGSPTLPMVEVFSSGALKKYESWLVSRRCSSNTISTYMRVLQAVYHRWLPPGASGYNPVLFKDVRTRVEAPTKRALTVQQISRLASTDFSSLSPKHQRALAYFLLMFMLRGMPFIDLAHLRKTDLQDGRIVYQRHKTGKPMVVDLLPESLRLIQKFRDKTDSVYLFPLLDGGLHDAEELYRCYQVALLRFNRELTGLMRLLLPGVKVSSYTARHTWATTAYHMGVSVGLISESLGHSSIQVTMAYLKPFDREVIDKVNKQVISFVRKCKKWKKQEYNMLYGTFLG